jgi:hypothetical protein
MNLYRIDDVLLRAGLWASGIWLGGVTALAVVGAPADAAGFRDVWQALRPDAPIALLAAACPVALLAAGIRMRRREKRILAFWSLLKRQAEIPVPELLANSDFTRDGLERAVRRINTKGLGYYVWNQETDVIQDGRLEREYLHVEKCDGCSAEISLQSPASLREIPRCPYCEDPVSMPHLARLRREALERLRARPRDAAALPEQSGWFSLVLFLIPLVSFWPAAIVYGWMKWEHAPSPRF